VADYVRRITPAESWAIARGRLRLTIGRAIPGPTRVEIAFKRLRELRELQRCRWVARMLSGRTATGAKDA